MIARASGLRSSSFPSDSSSLESSSACVDNLVASAASTPTAPVRAKMAWHVERSSAAHFLEVSSRISMAEETWPRTTSSSAWSRADRTSASVSRSDGKSKTSARRMDAPARTMTRTAVARAARCRMLGRCGLPRFFSVRGGAARSPAALPLALLPLSEAASSAASVQSRSSDWTHVRQRPRPSARAASAPRTASAAQSRASMGPGRS
mmetsp:Transcript_10094/g.34936  ORF Transcript_10094/g.34936 Transcript_10094/m.34936 type:complete len:207 (-) Transcript_10094:8-628(-)